MSWLYSQALVGEFLVANCLDGKPSAQLNVMPTQHKFWRNGKTMDALDHSRFGLTLQVLTESLGAELLTWFQQAFLAKTLVVQEKALELVGKEVDCGHKQLELLPSANQSICSSKTAQCLSLEDFTQSYPTLPKWGSMLNGVVYPLSPKAHHIKDYEYGSSLPTPSGCRSGKNHVAGRIDEWGGSSNPFRGTEIGKMHCPAFEEWVMGLPEQWTELTESAMPKFQLWLQMHGKSYQTEFERVA